MTRLAEIKETWDAYRASQVRCAALRERLRAKMRAAISVGITQSEIGRALGIARQHVHRYLIGPR